MHYAKRLRQDIDIDIINGGGINVVSLPLPSLSRGVLWCRTASRGGVSCRNPMPRRVVVVEAASVASSAGESTVVHGHSICLVCVTA